MNQYFEVGNERFESRKDATEQINRWRGDTRTFSVCEVQNTEVTRKTAKGNIITEIVRGSLERVPRIISAQKLNPTYVVVDSVATWNNSGHFGTRAEAEQERAKRQSEVERLAALTEADIKEVRVPTLADILDRDADRIKLLSAGINSARENWEQLEKQAKASIAVEVANLENQIAAVKAGAAKRFRLQEAEAKFNVAIQAHNKAIHYDEFREEVLDKMREEHNENCWPDSDCRQCTYDPEEYEPEEYLLEHAEEFEVEELTGEPAEAAAA